MGFQDFAEGLRNRRRSRDRGLILLKEVDSTHFLARRLVREYTQDGVVPPAFDVLAWCQLSGMGRGDHHWSSPPGAGLYATLVCPEPPREALQLLPLRVALALCDELDPLLGGRCTLKWPNDLMVDGRKLGGILIEVRGSDAKAGLVSFGVNFKGTAEALGEARATTLEAEGAHPEVPEDLMDRLLRAVRAAVVLDSSMDSVLEGYRARSQHQVGERMRCRTPEGPVEGLFQGFDPNGFLLLEVNGESVRLAAAEISTDDE